MLASQHPKIISHFMSHLRNILRIFTQGWSCCDKRFVDFTDFLDHPVGVVLTLTLPTCAGLHDRQAHRHQARRPRSGTLPQ